MLVIGIDLGTTNVKGVVFTREGGIVASVAKPTPVHYRGTEIADFDPEEFWQLTQEILGELVSRCPHPEAIRALSFASFGEAGVALDAKGAPLAPAIAWFDHRSRDVVDAWRRQIDEYEVFQITGMRVNHIPSLAKILWERRHLPEVYRKTKKWLFLASYLILRLTGEYRTDYSMASRSMLFDIRKKAWSERMSELTGVPLDLLPPAELSGTPVGEIRTSVASALGLGSRVTVVLGGHDHPCGALSAGVRQRGELLSSSGTGDALFALTDPGQIDERFFRAGVSCGCHVTGGQTYILGGTHTAGKLIDWFIETFYADSGIPLARVYEVLADRASHSPAGSRGVLVLPHLRRCLTPHNDPAAKGAILGLRSTHSLDDIVRAVFEGLALDLRVVLDTYSELTGDAYPEVKYIGGGSRSPFWIQVKADVLERRICVNTIQENASHGAALLAGIGSGVYQDAEEALHATRAAEVPFVPNPESSKTYRLLYAQVYRDLYRRLAQLNQDLEVIQRLLPAG